MIELSISPGFHINANPATFPYLIATEVLPGQADRITTEQPVYPSAVKRKFEFAEQPLDVYERDAQIKLLLHIDKATKGPHSLPIKVRVQACDDEKCYPPATLEGSIPVTVN